MSNKVVDISEKQPHFCIDALGGNQHVIPVQFFEDVAIGSKSLKELEEFEAIVPTIINEWLLSKGVSHG